MTFTTGEAFFMSRPEYEYAYIYTNSSMIVPAYRMVMVTASAKKEKSGSVVAQHEVFPVISLHSYCKASFKRKYNLEKEEHPRGQTFEEVTIRTG